MTDKAEIFTTPAGFIMLFVAVFVDGGEFLVEFIPYVGQILSVIIDIFAIVFIGGWMWIRSGQIQAPSKTADKTTKAIKQVKKFKWLRPLCCILEMIPIGSSFLPLWVLAVWLELKSS